MTQLGSCLSTNKKKKRVTRWHSQLHGNKIEDKKKGLIQPNFQIDSDSGWEEKPQTPQHLFS